MSAPRSDPSDFPQRVVDERYQLAAGDPPRRCANPLCDVQGVQDTREAYCSDACCNESLAIEAAMTMGAVCLASFVLIFDPLPDRAWRFWGPARDVWRFES